ncbi:MAG: V-type ATP synthase subunit E family protein [Candidatus Nanohaloarchaea archaeon]
MALQDVKNDILTEAKEKAEALEKEAESKSKKIKEEAESKSEKIKREAKKELEEKKKAERKKAVSNARMQARQKKLQAKQEKLQEAFGSFEEELQNLSTEERRELVEEAVRDAEFDVAKIKASKNYEEVIDERKLDFEEAEVNGFILISENGERSKNFSLEKIVEDFKDQYRKEVASTLFGEV